MPANEFENSRVAEGTLRTGAQRTGGIAQDESSSISRDDVRDGFGWIGRIRAAAVTHRHSTAGRRRPGRPVARGRAQLASGLHRPPGPGPGARGLSEGLDVSRRELGHLQSSLAACRRVDQWPKRLVGQPMVCSVIDRSR